jgi:SAM-dependent methyltransferase
MEHPREAQRLLDKVDAPAWIDRYIEPYMHGASSFLSVGCGPAVFLREMAENRPELDVVGVDVSSARIRDAEQRLRGLPNARACQGNAMALPFESHSFDVVFCRFLIEYLPDKSLAVREMARVCKPGGTILLQDLDGQLVWHFPEDPELQPATEKIVSYLGATGFDPFVGRKLFSLCLGANLTDVNVQIEPYHMYAGTIDEKEFSNWQAKLDIAMPQIRAALGSEQLAREYSEGFLAYLRRPETLSYSCLFTVSAAKPAL